MRTTIAMFAVLSGLLGCSASGITKTVDCGGDAAQGAPIESDAGVDASDAIEASSLDAGAPPGVGLFTGSALTVRLGVSTCDELVTGLVITVDTHSDWQIVPGYDYSIGMTYEVSARDESAQAIAGHVRIDALAPDAASGLYELAMSDGTSRSGQFEVSFCP